jgi:malonyl-CoA/methylmalonyl-CoA synthetase
MDVASPTTSPFHDVCDWIERHAHACPGAPFLILQVGRAISYSALARLVAEMGGRLLAHGVRPGDRVTAQVEKSPEALILYFACLWVGAIYMPLNTGYTQAEIEYFLGDAEPVLVIVDPAVMANMPAGFKVLTLDAAGKGSLMTEATSAPRHASKPDDVAAMCYTSGTTGRPKGAMISRRGLASNAQTLVEAWRVTSGDVLIHALPIYHVHGLFVATNTLLAAQGAMHFLPKFDVDAVLGLMQDSTMLMGVPTFYTRLLGHPGLTREVTRRMRLFVSGSAPLLAETHMAFERVTGHAILERYGMTETQMNTSNPFEGPRVPGTVGPALPGVEVRVVDPESGDALPLGETGMIEVRGPNLFSGYWRNPEKTAQDMRPDGFFITGDLGHFDAQGYLVIVGRGKDLIISGGLNIYPKEIESEINALPGVVESAVIGVAHPDFGEAVVAVIVADGPMQSEQVLAGLSDRLARFKQPRHFAFVDALPRNVMGKVQKNLLREEYATLFTQPA